MGFFSLFKNSAKENVIDFDIIDKFNKFINGNHYISKKEIEIEVNKCKIFFKYKDYFKEGILEKIIKKYKLSNAKLYKFKIFISNLCKINKIVNDHNQNYLSNNLKKEKKYLDQILLDYDPNVLLDDDQRKVVLSDEDYTLVIAGAGTGKTTTIAAKTKYLVEKKNIDPKNILIISFTNKAVNELKDRLHKKMNIMCPIATFHATGYSIIRKENEVEKLNIASSGFMYNKILEFFGKKIITDYHMMSKVVMFFSYYINGDFDVSSVENYKKDLSRHFLTSLKSDIADIEVQKSINSNRKEYRSIKYERLRSIEEVKIANYLYMHNIDYEYEKPYPNYIANSKKEYCPDFTITQNGKIIYLEHFGITEDGRHSIYSEEELKKYLKHINDKIAIHKKYNTKLIYTYSKYNDSIDLIAHLEKLLIDSGVVIGKRDTKEVYIKLNQNKDNSYFFKMIKLIMNFIYNFKADDYNESEFVKLKSNSRNERNKAFLDIGEQAYLYYQQALKEKNMVDFADMINLSTQILKTAEDAKQKFKFDYIFVDEYQDVSLQRFNLVKSLSNLTDAKIIAVGDDWQSIYGFSGSRIDLFTNFTSSVGYGNELKITHTYRNSQELIDIAGEFVQKNNSQIKKKLFSNKHIVMPVVLMSYSDDMSSNEERGKKGIIKEKAKVLDKILGIIKKRQKSKNDTILILGRYNFDAVNLERSNIYSYDKLKKRLYSKNFPDLNIIFMTVHSSKGLGFDDVIILNGEEGLYGFPSQIETDPVLKMVIKDDISYDYAEERRLFYVALTRTKNRVYILIPKLNPSRFIVELINTKSKNIYLNGNVSTNIIKNVKSYKRCPICGYPLYFVKNKYVGRSLWTCSNDPEICDFITNDLHGGKTRIRKCPSCKDGYLLIKHKSGENHYFLGCSKYKNDKSGCTYTEQLDYSSLDDE